MRSTQFVQLEFQYHTATELEYYKSEQLHQVKEDFNSLFNVAHNILKHSTSAAEKCLLGKNETTITENASVVPAGINSALNILKQICCTVACESDNKRDVPASIVGILSAYSGIEKAVLTLAAFALSYGELVYYTDRPQLNSFGLLISSLRRVDELIKVKHEEQFKIAISDLNGFTKLALELVASILELDNLSKKDFIDDHSVVTEITQHVERYSFLAIQVVVACMKQVNYLTYDRIVTMKGLSSVASSLNAELTTLKETVKKYKSIIAEWEAYWRLHTCFSRRRGIIEAFNCLMYPLKPELDCHTGEPVGVERLLNGKNVLLFISETNISEDDFVTLKRIYEGLENEHKDYKIVWIPVVEQWTTKSLQDFNQWKNRMPWYVVCYEASTPIVGIKYIKRRWQFSYKPMVVVLNSQGAIECLDAMQMIRAWGIDAFPFRPTHPDPGMRPIMVTINRKIEEGKYIFLYGGTNERWIKDFGTKLDQLTSNVSSKVSINSFPIGLQNSKIGKELFWTRMESLLYVRMQWNLMDDDATKHIQTLLSLQKEVGWAVLCKGSTILTCAAGAVIEKTVANYKEWITNLETKKFEICLQEHFKIEEPRPCRHVPILNFNGWLPVDVKCPDCGERMERVVTYQCCHKNAK